MRSIRLGAAQLNFVVGDIWGNVELIRHAVAEAESTGVELLVFPELALTGYPPEDLLLKPGFVEENLRALTSVAAIETDLSMVLGFVDRGDDLYNAAAFISGSEVVATYRKQALPNYGVFDELRYFRRGSLQPTVVSLPQMTVGVTICEDVWSPVGPMRDLAQAGAELIVNINASPFAQGKHLERQRMLSTRASDNSVALFYVNLVGGQDELVFDGSSLLYNHYGYLVGSAERFATGLFVYDLEAPERYRKRLLDPRGHDLDPPVDARTVEAGAPKIILRSVRDDSGATLLSPSGAEPLALLGPLDDETDLVYLSAFEPSLELGYFDAAETYSALVMGTRDYAQKNRFASVLVALSGGVDSALVATIAADALGPSLVKAVGLPSKYSSAGSVTDAAALAGNLGVAYEVHAIAGVLEAYLQMVAEAIDDEELGLTEENLQSRIRGTYMMALSNHSGGLVLTTGNKSELAVGYSTLYGDTAGGYAVIKDVLKTQVYQLCQYRNQIAGFDLIPKEILSKAPSAELRPDQRDDQSLPPYDLLDSLLYLLVDLDMTPDEVIARGFDDLTVRRIARLLDLAEYKRRQSPPGVRLTNKAFGKDRRMPITNGFR